MPPMQGGHPDGLVLPGSPNLPGSYPKFPDSDPHITEGISVPSLKSIPLGTHPSGLDKVIDFMRHYSSTSIALVVAFACGHLDGSISSFRRHKLARIKQGTETVIKIQAHRHKWYGPALTKYLSAMTFGAEEEFYLLVLPFIFWNLDWLFAHHTLFVVNVGLYVGNVMKDVFCLPRPDNVWRPAGATAQDSTGLKDYGFPSTHTMNSISNSLFALMYYYTGKYRSGPVSLPFPVAALLAAWWIASISFSRLFMGVHSPTDLRGGVVLGLLTPAIWYIVGDKCDILCCVPGAISLCLQLIAISFGFLLCCPQTRPSTPTFLQNAVNMGLITGNLMGANLHATIEASAAQLDAVWMDLGTFFPTGRGLFLVRYVIGMVAVIGARALAKVFFGAVAEAMGMHVTPKKGETQLSIRGWDLAGLAGQKFFVYFTLSTGVTAGAPALFHVLGLYEDGSRP